MSRSDLKSACFDVGAGQVATAGGDSATGSAAMDAEQSAALEALQREVDRVGDGALTEALRRVRVSIEDDR